MSDETTLAAELPKFGEQLTTVGKMLYIVHNSLERMWNWMANRGPDPDEPVSLYRGSVPVDLVKDLLEQASRRGNGNVNGSSWKAIAIVLGVLSALLMTWLAWFSNTVIDTRQDVAVIKCQLNPNCRVVVNSDKPP
jgi:hypothetical protein